MLRIVEHEVGGAVVLDFIGPLTGLEAAGIVKEALRRHGLTAPRTLIANFARVPQVDHAGAGGMLQGYGALREAGGEIRLAAVPNKVRDSVATTQLLTVFDAFESVEQALTGPIPKYAERVDLRRQSRTLFARIARLLGRE